MTDDYVLGTHDDELRRLGFQHQVWRPIVEAAWDRAGIVQGSRVVDVGSGPGYATVDLARRVGNSGYVLAIEKSPKFLQALAEARQRERLSQIEILSAELMEDPLPFNEFDFAWIRWVACFVSSPERLVQQVHRCLRPHGIAVFHEYLNYATFKTLPANRWIDEFVYEVMASWRANGGEPDIAISLPTILERNHFAVRETTPHIFCVQRDDPIWQWPAGFIRINAQRLAELGRVSEAWTERVIQEIEELERSPGVRMTTPLLLEIVAEKIEVSNIAG